MKNFLWLVLLVPFLAVAQTRVAPIKIVNTSPNTIPLEIIGSIGQNDVFFSIFDGTNNLFSIPKSGLIAVANGGTGVATVAALQALVSNAPTSGIVAVANGGTGTNSLALISVGKATLATNALISVLSPNAIYATNALIAVNATNAITATVAGTATNLVGGVTATINVLIAGGTTNALAFTNGVLKANTPL